jgi:hypothetical protein
MRDVEASEVGTILAYRQDRPARDSGMRAIAQPKAAPTQRGSAHVAAATPRTSCSVRHRTSPKRECPPADAARSACSGVSSAVTVAPISVSYNPRESILYCNRGKRGPISPTASATSSSCPGYAKRPTA